MAVWKRTVEAKAIFYNDDLSVQEKAREITKEFQRVFPSLCPPPAEKVLEFANSPIVDAEIDTFELIDLHDLLDEFVDVETEEEFDNVWNSIYDWANDVRVWINLF